MAQKARMGDVGLIHALFDALDLSAATRRKLMRSLGSGQPIEQLGSASTSPPAFAGMLKILETSDASEARAFVKDVMSLTGISHAAGRDTDAIADRFLRRAAGETGALPPEKASVLKRFLAISGEPDQALSAISAFATAEKINLSSAISQIESRIGFMAAQGVDLSNVIFETAFLRNLDYYTGFVFDVPSPVPGKPLIGGGRYDRLMRRLGAQKDIPAIGFALWPERLPEAQP
jgi:ATP phosphoribosyltransferase regulatory subunit